MKKRMKHGALAFMILGVLSCNKANQEDCGLDDCDLSGNFLCNVSYDVSKAGMDSSLTRSAIIPFYLVGEALHFDQYSVPVPSNHKGDIFYMTDDGLMSLRVSYLEKYSKVVAKITTYTSPGDEDYEVVIVGEKTLDQVTQNANAYHSQFNGEYEVYVEKRNKLNYGTFDSESSIETLVLQIEKDHISLGDSVMYVNKPFHDKWIKAFFSLDADTVRSLNYFSINPNAITFKMEWGVLNEDENIEGKEVIMTAYL